jgi:hypothetical protein
MKTIPVGLRDIEHWCPEAYEVLVRDYENLEATTNEGLTLQEYGDLFSFCVGRGRLFMACHDEGLVWEWDELDPDEALIHPGVWREFPPEGWHWGEGRPL